MELSNTLPLREWRFRIHPPFRSSYSNVVFLGCESSLPQRTCIFRMVSCHPFRIAVIGRRRMNGSHDSHSFSTILSTALGSLLIACNLRIGRVLVVMAGWPHLSHSSHRMSTQLVIHNQYRKRKFHLSEPSISSLSYSSVGMDRSPLTV